MARRRISVSDDRIAEFCRRHHIRRLSLFGSVLRDDFGPESDVDILVEFEPGHVPGLGFFALEASWQRYSAAPSISTRWDSSAVISAIRSSATPRRSMAAHDDIARLRHMLDHAREAVELIGNRNRASIIADRVLTLALVRLLEIVGEAAARVSQPTRSQYATIPWQQIVGLRNRSFMATTPSIWRSSGKSCRPICRR
jgi:uncharacterized protein with HEPN domain/predicted nucleotidyltransferase